MTKSLALAALLSATALSAQASTLLTNGDFEAGNTGFATGLAFTPGGNTNAAQYNVATNPAAWNSSFANMGDNTSGTGNMMMINGATTAGATVWEQTVSVTANTTYSFSGWIASIFPGASSVILAVNGAQLETVTGPSDIAEWEAFGTTWNSGASTSATVTIRQNSIGFLGNDYALDDLSFVATGGGPAVIPLPAAGAGS
jgi:hypothetical protein